MNIRRGLLRIWIAGSALWVALVATIWLPDLLTPRTPDYSVMVPIACDDRRLMADETKDGRCWATFSRLRLAYPEYRDLSDGDLALRLYRASGLPLGEEDKSIRVNSGSTRFVMGPRVLTLTKPEMDETMVEILGFQPRRGTAWLEMLGWMFTPPVVVFGFALLARWIIRGFRST
ncbi:MAG: hypothetical protein O9972_56375 [Burkholderiales bacterium]|nr:hypothetical protein [Burkholderiales bacterium]